jgi:hypothetical protein
MKTRSWQEILEFYNSIDPASSADMVPMAQLVEKIASSAYAQEIYGATSMQTLCIWQHQDSERDRNMLAIDFSKGLFSFTYQESPFTNTNWQKQCKPDESFATFEYVMYRLKWFLLLDES